MAWVWLADIIDLSGWKNASELLLALKEKGYKYIVDVDASTLQETSYDDSFNSIVSLIDGQRDTDSWTMCRCVDDINTISLLFTDHRDAVFARLVL